MGHLDRYEAEGIDAEFQDAVPAEDVMAARMSAERELRKRDIREARRRGLPGALEGVMQGPSSGSGPRILRCTVPRVYLTIG